MSRGTAADGRAVARRERADEHRDEGRQRKGRCSLAGGIGGLAGRLLDLGSSLLGLGDCVIDTLLGVGLAEAGLSRDDVGDIGLVGRRYVAIADAHGNDTADLCACWARVRRRPARDDRRGTACRSDRPRDPGSKDRLDLRPGSPALDTGGTHTRCRTGTKTCGATDDRRGRRSDQHHAHNRTHSPGHEAVGGVAKSDFLCMKADMLGPKTPCQIATSSC